MSEWISVEERLPEVDELVLLHTARHQIIVGFFDGELWCSGNYTVSWDYAFNHDVTITHWMPLPPAP